MWLAMMTNSVPQCVMWLIANAVEACRMHARSLPVMMRFKAVCEFGKAICEHWASTCATC